MQEDDYIPTEYISYGALGRSPMFWGIPYMVFLGVGSGSLLLGLVAGNLFGTTGWLLTLISIPILLFVKVISVTDDKAINILLLETKWMIIKKITGNSKLYGGTMGIAPTTYTRKQKDVISFIEKTVSR
jgi:type IV secretion system protein VirB3